MGIISQGMSPATVWKPSWRETERGEQGGILVWSRQGRQRLGAEAEGVREELSAGEGLGGPAFGGRPVGYRVWSGSRLGVREAR